MGGGSTNQTDSRTTLLLHPNAFRNEVAWQDRPAYGPLGLGRALFSNASILDVGEVACRRKGGGIQARQGKKEQLNEEDLPD